VQDVAAESIRVQSSSYFGFIIVGIAGVYILSAAAGALPGAVSGNIGSGTLEALLVTRTPVPVLLLGLVAYPLVQAALRALVLLVGAALLGVEFAWAMIPAALGVAVLLLAAYGGIGLIAAALVLVFRTSGPLITAVVALSGLLGGAYYATSAVPGWLHALTDFVPLTYALRAARMLLLGGASLADVVPDVSTLALMAVVSLSLGSIAFSLGLARARRAGTLAQY
jgi:ABC-2 type transport system permease protein